MLAVHDDGGFMVESLAEPLPAGLEEDLLEIGGERRDDRIGNYRLTEPLGAGGFGTVWHALQEHPVRREVALKIIKLGMDTREVIARFEQERQALALMNHPHVARVFDAGVTLSGRPFMVMELVGGIRITEYCDSMRLGVKARLELFILVCEAVQHAHQKGLIHRDLKPSNILVADVDGVPAPKIIDFGIAKATSQARLTDATFVTGGQQMIGTPLYMSPEQASHDGMDVDTRSDIYSLGVLLYELLTGRPPFDDGELARTGGDELWRAIRERVPRRPSCALNVMKPDRRTEVAESRQCEATKLRRMLRGDLDRIVMKTLEKEREQRYQTSIGLATDVRRYLAREPIQAQPPRATYRLRRLAQRNKVAFISGAAIILTVLAGLGVSISQTLRAREAEKSALSANSHSRELLRRASRSAHTAAEDFLRRGGWRSGVSLLGEALRNDPENSAAATHLWSALAYGLGDRDMIPDVVVPCSVNVIGVAFSPDGTRFATADEGGVVRIWEAATGQSSGISIDHGRFVTSVCFSPDGARLLSANANGMVQVWDVATGLPDGPPMQHSAPVGCARFSKDGLRIVTACHDKAVRLWDARTGRPLGAPLMHEDQVSSACFSPDGLSVASACGDGRIRLWDPASGKTIGKPFPQMRNQLSVQFSPDGTRLVSAGEDNLARIWDTASSLPIGEPLTHDAWVFSAVFSPDGTRVATASDDGTARIWDARTGDPMGEVMRHGDRVRAIDFSPDGTRIVTGGEDQVACIWQVATRRAAGQILSHGGMIRHARFDAGGTRVVTASDDGSAQIWNVTSATPTGPSLRESSAVLDASFSGDGLRVLTVSQGGTAQLWDAASGEPIGERMVHSGAVLGGSFSPDGSRVLTFTGSGIRLWDAFTGVPLFPSIEQPATTSATFSPDGTAFVTTNQDSMLRFWNATTGAALALPIEQFMAFYSASFSPDGSRVLAGGRNRKAQVWDVASQLPVGPSLPHKTHVLEAVFSPDGTRLATCGYDKAAFLWDAATGTPLGFPMRHKIMVRTVRFSAGGRRVVTASDDHTARVWDAFTGHPLGEPFGHGSGVWQAEFSPDGTRVVTASLDGPARLWDAPAVRDGGVWLTQMVDAACGLKLTPSGGVEGLSALERVRLRQLLQTVEPADQNWSRLLRWWCAAGAQRTSSPLSEETVRAWADRKIATGRPAALQAALEFDPGNPLIQIALSAIETDPIRAAFLREYGARRLPKDEGLRARAAQMLSSPSGTRAP